MPAIDPSIEMVQFPHQNCTYCRRAFSQSWPASIDKSMKEMIEHCEDTLRGNGWAKSWRGGWICRYCADRRTRVCVRLAPWVRGAAVFVASISAGLALWWVV